MLKATIYFSLVLKCHKVMFDNSIPKYSYVIYISWKTDSVHRWSRW